MSKISDVESGLNLGEEKIEGNFTLGPSCPLTATISVKKDASMEYNYEFNSPNNKEEKSEEKFSKSKRVFTIYGYTLAQFKWFNVFWLIWVHVLAIFGYVYVSLYPVKFWTAWWTILLGLMCGFGGSVGSHRLFAHRSFKAHWLLRAFLVFSESLLMNGGTYTYARDHRCHHKFVDTNGDPKNARRGFFFAHIGWWMVKKHPDVLRMGAKLNFADLNSEPLIVWQKKLYFPLFFLLSVVFPSLVPYIIWGEDLVTSFFMACVLRNIVLLHHLFCVNSVAHIWGKRPYNKNIGPAESKLTMYLAFGEGSHNYHHTFPQDYANCQQAWWEVFNPVTLYILVCEMLGLAWDLKKPSPQVVKGVVGRVGDPEFYENKLFHPEPLSHRICKGLREYGIGILVAGWAFYPPIFFKAVTGRPLFVF